MFSKAKIKETQALGIKKFRDEQALFVGEGDKIVSYLLQSFECERMIATAHWMSTQRDVVAKELILTEEEEIRKAGFLKSPHEVLAVFRKPHYNLEEANPASQLILALDRIQDPGNLGTIIRLSEWFGIEHIVCSTDTADVFSPKTVQATMGALANVKVHYTNLEEYILQHNTSPIFGTFLDGEDIHQSTLSQQGIIVMGNEGNGIRPEIESLINRRLHILSYPPDRKTTGSLNVATATAIVCATFRAKKI